MDRPKTAYVIKVSAEHSPIIEEIESGIMVSGTSTDKPFLRLSHSDPNKHDKIQHHNQNGLRTFFQDVMESLHDVDYVYLFGPGAAKEGLNNEIEKAGTHYRCKVTEIDPADRLTPNQMKQQVLEYFTSLRFEDSMKNLSVDNVH